MQTLSTSINYIYIFFAFVCCNCRYNSSSLNEYRIEDSDERARIQRAIEIQEGIEIDQVTSPDLIESLTSHNSRTSSGDEQQEHCKRCQQNQIQYRQMGIVQQALLSIADDENNPRYHSQVCNIIFIQ